MTANDIKKVDKVTCKALYIQHAEYSRYDLATIQLIYLWFMIFSVEQVLVVFVQIFLFLFVFLLLFLVLVFFCNFGVDTFFIVQIHPDLTFFNTHLFLPLDLLEDGFYALIQVVHKHQGILQTITANTLL